MKNILVGRPSFSDWATAIDKVASRSGGTIQVHTLDDAEEALSYARRFRMQAVIPMTYPQMKVLAPHRDRFDEVGIRLVCSDSYELIQTFDDKVRFIHFMDEQDLMHLLPDVYVVSHNGQRTDYAEIQYPCIFKLAVTFGGTGSTVHLTAQKPVELDKVARGTSYLVQQFIPGNVEYGGHIYVEGGAIRKQLYYRGARDASVHVQRGRMPKFDRFEELDEAAELESMFGAVNFTGFACVDFKVSDQGIKIFEVNPRLGGTLIHNEPDLLSFFEAARES